MALLFAGSPDALGPAATAALRPSLPITIAAWIRPDDVSGTGGIYNNNKNTDGIHRGAWLNLSAGGGLDIGYGNNGGGGSNNRRSKAAAAGFTDGAWQYASCSIRGAGDMSAYRNGSDVGGSYSGTGGGIAYNTGVGGRIGVVVTSYFLGRIAEVAVWNVSLTDDQHLALARGASPLRVRPAALLQYFPIWDSAMYAVDLSPLQIPLVAVAGSPSSADHAPVGSPFPVAA